MKSYQILFCLGMTAFLMTGCGKASESVAETEIIPETAYIAEMPETSVRTETTKKASFVQTIQTTVSAVISETEMQTTEVSSIMETSGITSGTSQKRQTTVTTKTTTVTQVIQPEQETIIIYQYDNAGRSGNAGTASGRKNASTTAVSETTASETETSVETTEFIPETEEITEPETEPLPKTGTVPEILDMMTLEEKIYQLFVVTPEVLTGANVVTAAGTATHDAVVSQPVAGLIYFADNLVSRSQTNAMLANTQAYARESGIGMFLAVDEEGGLVARCAKKLGTTKFSPMASYGKDNDWNTAYWIGETLGNDISQFGFNLDFAPVADVNLNSGNELGTRIFSDNPDTVGNMVSGVVEGLQNTGVAATLKHFPGLGAENGNAHYDDKIIIDRSLDDLRNAEFIPFQYGINAGADFVMVSHQIVTGAGDGLPACLSPVVCTDWLRYELGFDGILITDAFNMNTISGSYSPGDAAVMAIEAGVDIILMPTDLTASVEALENAVDNGLISEARINQSVERILNEKEKLNLLE